MIVSLQFQVKLNVEGVFFCFIGGLAFFSPRDHIPGMWNTAGMEKAGEGKAVLQTFGLTQHFFCLDSSSGKAIIP